MHTKNHSDRKFLNSVRVRIPNLQVLLLGDVEQRVVEIQLS